MKKKISKTILITGATGSLGEVLVKKLIDKIDVVKIIAYARDEYKMSELEKKIDSPKVEYWLGDIRNLERLKEACEGVDIIIHTAALKRMDTVSHNVSEVADVNITGTKNVAIAGKNCEKIIFVSTDKANEPSCIYGASKMIAEGIILARKNGIVWRFGNFIDSRGSVFEIFKKQKESGELTITHPSATRFVIDMEEVCDFLLGKAHSGINYPPSLKSMSILEIANSIAPKATHKIIGLREGEKMHESFNKYYTSKK